MNIYEVDNAGKEPRKKLGEGEMVKKKNLWVRNLLVICKTEEQKIKARQVEGIGKKLVGERRV